MKKASQETARKIKLSNIDVRPISLMLPSGHLGQKMSNNLAAQIGDAELLLWKG